jgi:hypothetical protein
LPLFVKAFITTQGVRLKVDRLKEKTPACAGAAGRLAGDGVMDDHYCPSVFSLQPKHLSSYRLSNNFFPNQTSWFRMLSVPP